MQASLPSRHAGLTLVEMMIALVLGLVVTGAIVGVFIAGSRSYTQDEQTTGMHDELRFAMASLQQELEMAGFWGRMLNYESPAPLTLDPNLSVDVDCGNGPNWAYTHRQAVSGLDNVAGVSATYSCIGDDEIQPGSDVLVIKRVSGQSVAAAPADGTTLRSNSNAGILFSGGAPSTPVAVGGDLWQYRPSIYYVRNFGMAPGDNIPTLCRKAFVGRSFVTEPLAQGIENFQVEYGVDSTNDGIADSYLTADDVTDFDQVSSVRVWLLSRSANPDKNYKNLKTYTMSNMEPVSGGEDPYYRKIASTLVVIRNPNALRVQLGRSPQ